MGKENNLRDYLVDLYQGIASKNPNASRNPQDFRSEIENMSVTGTLVPKNVNRNGTYLASDDNVEGYSSVVVDVPSTIEVIDLPLQPTAYDAIVGVDTTHLYYIEDEDNIFIYTDAGDGAGLQWVPLFSWRFVDYDTTKYIGSVTNTSDATEPGVYAVISTINDEKIFSDMWLVTKNDDTTVSTSFKEMFGDARLYYLSTKPEGIDLDSIYKKITLNDVWIVYPEEYQLSSGSVRDKNVLPGGKSFVFHYKVTKPNEDICLTPYDPDYRTVEHIYYIEDEDNIFVYTDGEDGVDPEWMEYDHFLPLYVGGINYKCVITNTSEATEPGFYALVGAESLHQCENGQWINYIEETRTKNLVVINSLLGEGA